jgi:hypothetical protein
MRNRNPLPGSKRRFATLFALLLGTAFLSQTLLRGEAQISQSMASATRPDEFDTADRRGGQIGGTMMGIGYKLEALRCPSGQVMAGVSVQGGDYLSYIQISCATPSCAGSSCMWASPRSGMSAGDPNSGDAHPAMLCRSNEIVSGIRGSVVIFASRPGFDYAREIEIECSPMTSAAIMGPSGHGFYPVASSGSGSWQRTSGYDAVSQATMKDSMTRAISCKSGGYGATAVSVGIANFLGQRSQLAVQAVSLYCPRIAPATPRSPSPELAESAGKKQKIAKIPTTPHGVGESAQAPAGLPQQQASLRQQGAAFSNPTDFRLMTPEDAMWADKDYAGTMGYFPASSTQRTNCHGFVGEMGVATTAQNLCGDEYLQKLPRLPAGTPHQLGDFAVIHLGVAKASSPWHSAIFIGCNLYLQRNGSSAIQVIGQSYLDNFTSSKQVDYVRPIGLGTFTAKLAALKAGINPGEAITAAAQATMSQIKGCFP